MFIDTGRQASIVLSEKEFGDLTQKLHGLYALDLEPAFSTEEYTEVKPLSTFGVCRDMNEKGLQKSHKSEG